MFVIIFCWDVSFWVGGDGSSEIIDLINTSIIFPSFWRSIYLTMKTSTEWKVNIFVGIWKIPQHNSSTPEKLPPMKFRPGQLPPGHLRPGQLPQKSPPGQLPHGQLLSVKFSPVQLSLGLLHTRHFPKIIPPWTTTPEQFSPLKFLLGQVSLDFCPWQ